MGIFGMAYAAVSYTVFLASFLWAICFVGDFLVLKTINSGTPIAWPAAVILDIALLALFAVQHSVMARPGFKLGGPGSCLWRWSAAPTFCWPV